MFYLLITFSSSTNNIEINNDGFMSFILKKNNDYTFVFNSSQINNKVFIFNASNYFANRVESFYSHFYYDGNEINISVLDKNVEVKIWNINKSICGNSISSFRSYGLSRLRVYYDLDFEKQCNFMINHDGILNFDEFIDSSSKKANVFFYDNTTNKIFRSNSSLQKKTRNEVFFGVENVRRDDSFGINFQNIFNRRIKNDNCLFEETPYFNGEKFIFNDNKNAEYLIHCDVDRTTQIWLFIIFGFAALGFILLLFLIIFWICTKLHKSKEVNQGGNLINEMPTYQVPLVENENKVFFTRRKSQSIDN